MSFNVSIGGLRAANKRLEMVGHNIANAGTVGFKSSRAEFAALYSSAQLGNGRNAVGDGVRLTNISQNFNQGTSVSTEGRPLDMRIQGGGFFVLNDRGSLGYTRAGAFLKDAEDFVVDSEGGRLQGYGVNDRGEIMNGVRTDLKIDTANMGPKATARISETLNLDASQPSLAELPAFNPNDSGTYTHVTTRTIQDDGGSTGAPKDHKLEQFFVKTDSNQWSMYSLIDGRNPIEPGNANPLHVTLNKQPNGTLSFSGNTEYIRKVSDDEFEIIGWRPAENRGGQWASSTAGNNGAVSLSLLDGGASSLRDSDPVMPRSTPEFDPFDSKTYNHVFPSVVYDSQGNRHDLKQYVVKDGVNSWRMHVLINDRNPVSPDSKAPLTTHMVFNSDGSLRSLTGSPGLAVGDNNSLHIQGWMPAVVRDAGTAREQWVSNGAVASQDGIAIDLSKLSQHNATTSRTSPQVDGHAAGELSGLSIDRNGILRAGFTNGLSKNIGQVMLARFANEQGLLPRSDTRWSETLASGVAEYSAPGVGTLGSIIGGALEGSNVELADQLIEMIQAQTAYQANSKAISTEATLLQTLIQST